MLRKSAILFMYIEACRLVQSIQLGFIFSCTLVTTILSNTYLSEFVKNLARRQLFLLFGRLSVYEACFN